METPYVYDYEMRKIINDRGRLIGPRGSTNDGRPELVPDWSRMAMITDRMQVETSGSVCLARAMEGLALA
ncbi:hypothetical protein PIB30_039027 [Stylosanthes scabra]|uniref:Uncharacterized protein n=1 Tax=Stylosanthes scabra TaxID=79078 RepID=A0ABU6REK1_9FABA|nr:hypothetical protein [Stylosanthes scabra]